MKKFSDFIVEGEEIHAIFSGRFQPITKAHASIIETIGKENKSGTIFLVKGKATSKDKEANPFDAEIQQKMLEKIAPKNVQIKIIPTGFFVDELNEMPYDNFVAYAGTDRVGAYKRFTSYLEEGKTLEIKEIKRGDDDISATKVRDALKNGDEKEFKKLTDSRIHSMYNELKEIINGQIK